MKALLRHTPVALHGAIVILALSFSLQAAEPLTFEEISLLLRMRESDTEIVRQLGSRRLLRGLAPNQEAVLQTQGASDALLKTLRDPRFVLSDAEATAVEARRTQAKKVAQAATDEAFIKPTAEAPAKDKFHVFEIPYGQSVNLSRWGGPTTDIKFFRKGASVVAVSGRPAFIDPFARADATSVYKTDPLHYYAQNQIIVVNQSNRVIVAGQPVLYPIYEASGASLFVTDTSTPDGVTIAVKEPKR